MLGSDNAYRIAALSITAAKGEYHVAAILMENDKKQLNDRLLAEEPVPVPKPEPKPYMQ